MHVLNVFGQYTVIIDQSKSKTKCSLFFDLHSNCLAFLYNAGSGKGKTELQSIASQLNRDKKVFLESLRNIRSNSECSSKKMHSNSTADSTVNKTFPTSHSSAERTPKEHSKGHSNLCLRCFPSVEDKTEFKSFVEELFKGTLNL